MNSRYLDPAVWGAEPTARVREVETHISRVFLVGDLAFKVKKAVEMPFLDFRALDARRRACEAEVELNRRLAPSTYRAVRALVDRGEGPRLAEADAPGALEYVVEMRRFDERDTLAARVIAGTATADDIGTVAGVVASFHGAAAPAPAGSAGAPVMRTLADSFATLLGLHPDRQRIAALARSTSAFLARSWTTLERRAADGLVRDGHGDLRAEHVVLGPRPEIVDCVEFSTELRVIDVSADVAFLVMDLVRLGRPDLADAFVEAYRAAGGDPGDDALVAFFATGRALVRAKVAMLRAVQVEASQRRALHAEADHLLEVAERFTWQARGPLAIVVCGPAASGKSTLAQALGGQSGFRVVSTDVVRKSLAGLEPHIRGAPELYDAEHDRRTYDALLSAAFAGAAGSVIIDGTFRHDQRRRDLEGAARAAGMRLLVLECRLPDAELFRRARIRHERGHATSDATPAVARDQAASWRSWLSAPADAHAVVRTDGPLATQLSTAADLADRSLPSHAGPALTRASRPARP